MLKKGLRIMNNPVDPNTYSRPEYATTEHIHIELNVYFEKNIMEGYVVLNVKIKDTSKQELLLDVHGLEIKDVREIKLNQPLTFKVGTHTALFGAGLSINLPKTSSTRLEIRINYKTSNEAKGLQWLNPLQTAAKKHPFLFSQFEAIFARTVLPCQDTPAVKTSYSAVITAPATLTVLMSAVTKGSTILENGRKEFKFIQKVPIPSYLIAIVVGHLVSKTISGRIKIWAEEQYINSAHYEFADTERQLQAAEQLCGTYVWGRYDLLMLPPSFSFGGMENPCLTFVTPTILVGDRSLASVIAHEIAHSWTGNLVTNINFQHFWINEGLTVFIERRIISKLHGWEVQDFQAAVGLMELEEAVKELASKTPELTALVINLTNADPNIALNKIPYEKGSIFLRYLELVVGGPVYFETFMREFVRYFQHKSIETKHFKEFFEFHFTNFPKIKSINWNSWIYERGMPPITPRFDSKLITVVENMWQNIKSCFNLNKDDVAQLSGGQRAMLLLNLHKGESLSLKKLLKLEDLFDLRDTKNPEIKFRWYRLCLKGKWLEKVDEILKWVGEVGRLKYIIPLYGDLYAIPEVQERTISSFKKYRSSMMIFGASTIAKILHVT